MKVCSVCVMDETDPSIYFDNHGQCNYCLEAEMKFKELGDVSDGQERMKLRISNIKQRNSSAPYDVVMGVSGGVDSSYAIVKAKNLGLRILAVHCDVGWNSDIAVSNIPVGDFSISITLSIGVVFDSESDISQQVNEADSALYKAKDNGRNQVVVFGAELEN